MEKLYFASDYMETAAPEIIERLAALSGKKFTGYGSDEISESAREKIRTAAGTPEGEVYFLVGGTQTNATVIDTMLRPYEGVIAAVTGHVSVHEAGAIEYGGHKVLALPSEEGKTKAKDIDSLAETYWNDENHEHMVMPAMVYISQPTEYGTLYSLKELREISRVCRKWKLALYVDGARLAYGLSARENDVTLKDLASLTDVFYIGGTKCGALCGEAVVFCGMHAPAHPIPRIKQHGALLAKGRLTGVQFEALFTDGLYFEIGRQAIQTAQALRRVLHERGYQFFLETPTNQQFVILPNEDMARIREHAAIEYWEKYDDTHTVVRFCTSWATTQEDIDALAAVL